MRAGSSEPSEVLVGVTSQPPSSQRTLILPDEPGVSPRSNSERPSRHISSRNLVSSMAFASRTFPTLWQRGQAVLSKVQQRKQEAPNVPARIFKTARRRHRARL